ncbi:MAG: HAMP domain-containing sensor histidine kinase [Gemmatimonadaceae bacterium]|nr:HAMP domain-containing sensor histidine kinase [Gemmatimonadaceae bacterium]
MFVGVSLLALAVVPIVTSARVRQIRRALTQVSDPARVLVHDVQRTLAVHTLALGELSRPASSRTGPEDVGRAGLRYRTALAEERRDEVSLAPLARDAGPAVLETFVEFRTISNQRHRAAAPLVSANASAIPTVAPRPVTDVAPTDAMAEAAVAAAGRLESRLASVRDAQRIQISDVERWDRTLPALLASVTVVSIFVVVWARRQILALADHAERARQVLVAASATSEGLMRGVTHDLMYPLGTALGNAQILEDGALGAVSDSQREVVVRMRRLVQLSVDTVGELLELSRSEGGQLRLSPVRTDAAALVRDSAGDYRAAAPAAALTLDVTRIEAPVPVTTDARRVRQVLGNMLSNALKYTPGGGVVQVSLATGPGQVTVSVTDAGPGIPAAFQDRVFDEFFRVPSTRDTAAGTGVGLTISRRIARLLGGDLTLASPPEGGARFTPSLPIDRPAVAARRSGASTMRANVSAAA